MNESDRIIFRVQWLVLHADRRSVCEALGWWDRRFLTALHQRLVYRRITENERFQLKRIEAAVAELNEDCPINQPWLYRPRDARQENGRD